ncbi:hypothetical protein [Pontiella desulfatans]|nr:hypothetical protein [Pontiella desulfatans]
MELNLDVSLPHESIMIGDQVELSITTICPSNGVVELPEIGHEKDIVVLKRDWESTPLADGNVLTETIYTLTSFRLGEHVLTTNPVVYRMGGKALTNAFPETTIRVVSSLGQISSSEIADIKKVHKLPGRIPPWIWIVLGSAVVAFLVGLVTSKLWKNRETLVPKAPPVPPHVVAFKALDALMRKGLLEKDECNPFYTELSMILRTYLEGRFQLNAPDETTEEIVEEMSKSPELDGNQRNILQEFMRQADMVKFAKGHPDRTTMESAFNTTRQFVEQTKQTEELATRERREPKEGEG